MIFIHVHLLPWHWFWRNHHNINDGVKIWWRGPFAVVYLDSDIWPETATIKAVTAFPNSGTPWEKPDWRVRFHP